MTPRTVARQAPLSMAFPRQEYWGGLPLPSPGDLAHPEMEPRPAALQADSLPSEPAGKPKGKCRSSASGNRRLTKRGLCDVVVMAGNGRIPAPSKGPVAAQQQEILYRKRE